MFFVIASAVANAYEWELVCTITNDSSRDVWPIDSPGARYKIEIDPGSDWFKVVTTTDYGPWEANQGTGFQVFYETWDVCEFEIGSAAGSASDGWAKVYKCSNCPCIE